jgi:hypothetical protein
MTSAKKLADVPPAALAVADAARYLGISETALRARQRNGDIEFRYLTSHPVVLVADLDALLAAAPTERASA